MDDPVICKTDARPRPVTAQSALRFVFADSPAQLLLDGGGSGIIIIYQYAGIAIGDIKQVVDGMPESTVQVRQFFQVGGLYGGLKRHDD